jgi:protein-tyrosine kinase
VNELNTEIAQGADKSIGSILSETFGLTSDQLDKITQHQRAKGLRFGEAAVNLGILAHKDVVWALSRQFEYQYSKLDQQLVPPELVTALDPFCQEAENFRAIRSNLVLGKNVNAIQNRAIAILSTQPSDGKTYFALNLAVSLSQLGAKTAFIDANLRNARASTMLGHTAASGLSSVLSRRAPMNIHKLLPEIDNLFILPAGTRPPNPLELLQRPVFSQVLSSMIAKFDFVIVDSPALSQGADSRAIAHQCGASIAVCRKGITQLNEMDKLIKQVSNDSHQFLGVVNNDFKK